MRYHYEPKKIYFCLYGKTYECDHPVYNRCTLYLQNGKGLAVIQQRYDPETKRTWWTEIDPWLVDDIYLCKGFNDYFNKFAAEPNGKLYPTVTVRQIMWNLRQKPNFCTPKVTTTNGKKNENLICLLTDFRID